MTAGLGLDQNAADRENKNRGGDRRVFGERHGQTKLTSENVIEIVRMVSCGEQKSVVARKFGVSRKTVLNIVRGSVWSHVTGIA